MLTRHDSTKSTYSTAGQRASGGDEIARTRLLALAAIAWPYMYVVGMYLDVSFRCLFFAQRSST